MLERYTDGMNGVFVVLFLVFLILLIWGLIAPQRFAKHAKNGKFTRKNAWLGFGVITAILFVLVGITAPNTVTNSSQKINLTSDSTPKVPSDQITTKQITETKPIAFQTTEKDDATLAKGQTKIVQAGQDGVETSTYQVTYTNGKQTGKTLISDLVTTKPIDQIIANGTYTAPQVSAALNCTNGTYVSSSGNTVCRPEGSASAPAGATALCGDGTYSFSQSHSGTCSHHSGVAEWL